MFRVFSRTRTYVESKSVDEYSVTLDLDPYFESFLKKHTDHKNHLHSMVELLEEGLSFLYIHKKTRTTLALRELANGVGLITFIHLFQKRKHLIDLVNAIRFKSYIVKINSMWPDKVFKRLLEVGFEEEYGDGSIPLYGTMRFVQCIDKKQASRSKHLWSDIDITKDGEYNTFRTVELEYYGCNDVVEIIDTFDEKVTFPRFTAECTAEQEVQFQILIAFQNNPICVSFVHDSTFILLPIVLESATLALVQKRKLLFQADLYSIGKGLFVRGDEIEQDTKFVRVFDSQQLHVGYGLKPKLNQLKVHRFNTKLPDALQMLELQRVRDESTLFFKQYPELKAMFQMYVSEYGRYSYIAVNKWLQLFHSDRKKALENDVMQKHVFFMIQGVFNSEIVARQSLVLFRGIRTTHWNTNYNTTIVQESFMSTSSRLLEEFHEKRCCNLVITVPTGTPILYLGNLSAQREDEFLLPPGLILEIDRICPITDGTLLTTIQCHVRLMRSLEDWYQQFL